MDILTKAGELVNGPRQSDYGPPAEDFRCTAWLWNAWLRRRHGKTDWALDAKDVAIMMVLLKISREAYKHKPDNLVDAAGYLQTAMMVEEGA